MEKILTSKQVGEIPQREPEWVDVKELARRLSLKEGWIRQHMSIIPHRKFDRLVRFNVQEVMESFKSG